jgi:hypothetical protein
MVKSRSFILKMGKLQTKFVEKIKTNILRLITLFFENLYEMTWKYVVRPDKPQGACLLENKGTHSQYVILLALGSYKFTNLPQCYIIRSLHYFYNREIFAEIVRYSAFL